MKKSIIALIVLIIVVFAACTKKAIPSKTVAIVPAPVDKPMAPPKPVLVAYTTSIQPLIEAKCSPCHLPARGGNKADFSNYTASKERIQDMIARIQLNPADRGFMPFKHGKLSDSEIALFKKWQSDGLVEN